jgi:Spy/CpxP family protein refolding chaperone
MICERRKTMRNSSKIWLLGGLSALILISAIAFPLVGQANEKCWKPGPEEVLCRLDARLDLTAEQKEKLTPIVSREMEKRHKMMEKHRQEMAKLRNEFRGKMEKERESTQKEFASVLTDDQMKEFEKMTDERRERWKEKAGHGGHRGPGKCW